MAGSVLDVTSLNLSWIPIYSVSQLQVSFLKVGSCVYQLYDDRTKHSGHAIFIEGAKFGTSYKLLFPLMSTAQN